MKKLSYLLFVSFLVFILNVSCSTDERNLKQCIEQFNNSTPQEAITCFKSQLDSDNENGIVNFWLGKCYQKLDNLDSAIYYFKKSVSYQIKHDSAYQRLKSIYLSKNRVDSALYYLYADSSTLFADSLNSSNSSAETKILPKSGGNEKSKENISAKQTFAKLYALGLSQSRQGKYDEAISTLEKAAELDSSEWDPYLAIGNIYAYGKKNSKQAAIYFEKALKRINETNLSSQL